MTTQSPTRRWTQLTLRVAAVAAGLGAAVFAPQEPSARMQPYYIVRADGGAAVGVPRIMFVLDTSSSMGFETNLTEESCQWSACETAEDGTQSRIKSAREAIREVAIEAQNLADFGMMTFDSLPPPTSTGQVPTECTIGSGPSRYYARFRWADEFEDENGDTFSIDNTAGGAYELCGDNRPYPYIRYDQLDLNNTSLVANNQSTLPASPIVAVEEGDGNDIRQVQWFPEFLGVRAQLNSTTDPDGDILDATYGDYSDSDVWEADFYYWPYVDGFPGYSAFESPDGTPLGVAEPDNSSRSARLHVPFYLRSAITAFSGADRGPESSEEAFSQLMDITENVTDGGVDTGGDTPWLNVIGPIPAAPPQTNSVWSHTTVSSYLKYTRNLTTDDLCTSMVAILITDGDPETHLLSQLHGRLADLRTEISVKTYVVGFLHGTDEINDMACASAGSDDDDAPCTGNPANNWDTCNDPSDPTNSCVFLADSAENLVLTLSGIIQRELGQQMPTGPSATVNDFGLGTSGLDIAQTSIGASTDFPGWTGHVTRALCDTEDPDNPGQLAPWCAAPAATDEMLNHEEWGPCSASWEWDAGTCLQQTTWSDRRLYTHDANNDLVRIADASGAATSEFQALASTELGISLTSDQANALAEFVLGKDWPDGWKLSGLANSSPLITRRVPPADRNRIPAVGIRDPHCAGRLINSTEQVPEELIEFSEAAWTVTAATADTKEHYQYQEAVVVGDDLGILHAFHLHSGNEIFGFIPRMLLSKIYNQSQLGTDNMAQPRDLDEHYYGVAATVNDGWVYDDDASTWRHLAVFGLGVGGTDYIALDIAHMGEVVNDDPVDVLWTTEDAAIKSNYDDYLGETWSRPALTYQVTSNEMSQNPSAYLVFGSGYQTYATPDPTQPQGRRIWLVDALTGEPQEHAVIPTPPSGTYEENFGALVDIAVGTHCISKFWGESEEAYILDPAGRLFRWDLGHLEDADRNHEADSGGKWSENSNTAAPLASFTACQEDGSGGCIVGSKPENFVYAPAVVSINRIDSKEDAADTITEGDKDQFLIAMNSGSTNDDTVNTSDSDLHTSLYILADDHRADPTAGLSIPTGGGITEPGDHSTFMRVPLTDIQRERCITYPTDDPDDEPTCTTAYFSKDARPLASPTITVHAGLDNTGEVDASVEILYFTFTIYEPGDTESCDTRWYDADTDSYLSDPGSTFEVLFRLTLRDGEDIDFQTGSGGTFSDADQHGFTGPELAGPIVRQVTPPSCEDGTCGRAIGAADTGKPCDPNQTGELETGNKYLVVGSWNQLNGFTPTETAAGP